jgi:hypothetical protein
MAPYAEATAPGLPRSLTRAPDSGAPGTVECSFSTGRSVALIAILAVACFLVTVPAIVAGISMVDPDSLDQAFAWFGRFSSLVSYLDYAKIFVTLGSVTLVFRVARGSRSLEYGLETG